jgi:predicted Ser/Thr protein kinase
MNSEWKKLDHLLRSVRIRSREKNQPVHILEHSEQLQCIGKGTDAAVFKFQELPELAFKVYSNESILKKEVEAKVYKQLEGSSFFAQYYGSGDNYIVISYEQGINLYDCLLRGIPVPSQVFLDVEEAIHQVVQIGLNPRDIHLKNVLLQNGRGKVLDVSEYGRAGNDRRWEHLVWAYHHVYPTMEGRRIPAWLLEWVKRCYYAIYKNRFAN